MLRYFPVGLYILDLMTKLNKEVGSTYFLPHSNKGRIGKVNSLFLTGAIL